MLVPSIFSWESSHSYLYLYMCTYYLGNACKIALGCSIHRKHSKVKSNLITKCKKTGQVHFENCVKEKKTKQKKIKLTHKRKKT